MIGLGKWQGSINVTILKFSGDVFITIADNNGEYDVQLQLPEQLSKVKLNFESITEQGDDTLKGDGKLLTPAGRSLPFKAEVTFSGDEVTGFLKISLATIKIKNGHKIA